MKICTNDGENLHIFRTNKIFSEYGIHNNIKSQKKHWLGKTTGEGGGQAGNSIF